MNQSKAKIRVCARCERIFILHKGCPHCGFAHYGAIWAVGLNKTILGLLTHWITKPKTKEALDFINKNC